MPEKTILVRSLLACAASQYSANALSLSSSSSSLSGPKGQQVSLAVWIVDALLDTEQPFQEVYSAELYDRLVDALASSSGACQKGRERAILHAFLGFCFCSSRNSLTAASIFFFHLF